MGRKYGRRYTLLSLVYAVLHTAVGSVMLGIGSRYMSVLTFKFHCTVEQL